MAYPKQLTKAQFRRHEHLARADDVHEHIMHVEEGWAAQYVEMPNGLRQITTFYLPGEYCEPELFLSGKSALPIRALTPVVASLIPLSGIDGRAGVDVTEMLKAIVENSRRHTSLMVSLGRRTAPERIAYLTLNLFNRMDAEKKTVDGRCSFPLTQQDLGDATGMTPVHVNRVLQDLRRDGVIELTGKTLTVLDLKGLRDKAGPL